MESEGNDVHKWGVAITLGFHDEKKAVLGTLKGSLIGTGKEDILRDSGIVDV